MLTGHDLAVPFRIAFSHNAFPSTPPRGAGRRDALGMESGGPNIIAPGSA